MICQMLTITLKKKKSSNLNIFTCMKNQTQCVQIEEKRNKNENITSN